MKLEGYYKIEETEKKEFGEAVKEDWEPAQYTFKFGEVGVPDQDGYIKADEDYHPLGEKYPDKQTFWINNDEKGYASQDVSVRITNQLKPINIVIEKSWDPKKPEQVEEGIKFELQRKIESGKFENVIGDDGKIVSIDYKDFKNNKYTIKDLPRLDNNGNRYIYKVIEKLPENSNYTSVEDGTNPKTKADFVGKDEVTFIFTNIVETIDIPVEKTWEDEDNQYKSRPDSIRVQLYKDESPIEGKTLELKASDKPDENWKGVFEEMPYKENGKEVKYSVKEVEVPTGYKEEIIGDSLEGFTIKNTLQYSQVKLKKTVSGNMYDSNSKYEFTYKIVKDGMDESISEGTITLEKDGTSETITVPVGYKLVDGDRNTFWHNDWQYNNGMPQSVDLKFDEKVKLTGFNYVARQSGTNGDVRTYKLYTSEDGKTWTEAYNGEFSNNGSKLNNRNVNLVEFEKPIETEYLRFEVTSSFGGTKDKFASGAELEFTYLAKKFELTENTPELDIVDKTPLAEAIREALKVKTDKFTEESVDALNKQLEEVKKVLANPEAGQEEVNEAVESLKKAIEDLVKIVEDPDPVDPENPDPVDPTEDIEMIVKDIDGNGLLNKESLEFLKDRILEFKDIYFRNTKTGKK